VLIQESNQIINEASAWQDNAYAFSHRNALAHLTSDNCNE